MAIEVNVTDFGKSLLVKALNNTCPILFTYMKFGNGANPEDAEFLVDLVNPLVIRPITRVEQGENYIQLTSSFTNADVATDFSLTEIGVFAMDQDGLEVSTSISGSGISGVDVDKTDFVIAFEGNPGTYVFSYSDGAWHYNLAVVDLNDYGLSVTGTPASGDTISAVLRIGQQNYGTHLFAYVNQGEDAEPIYGSDSNKLKENSFSVVVIVDNNVEVTAIVKSLSFVTLDMFDSHILDYDNPHRVNAAQLGLDHVPNVSTNDQTPTFARASTLADLISGETLSTLFGKLSKAVNSLISHIGNTSNPHSVTASQIQAAAASHTHSAADVQSGTLSVARGGTGKSQWSANGVIYANTATTLAQATPTSANSVLLLSPNAAPSFTTVANIQNVSIYSAGTSAPSNTKLLWIDTTATTGGLKYYNGSSWVHVPTAYSG